MDLHAAAAALLLAAVLAAAIAGRQRCGRLLRRIVALLERVRAASRRPEAPRPTGRPIEDIAFDVRRLGARFHYPPPRTTFARFEGRRCAYDHVLVEACRALEVEQLLDVITPGPDLDRERYRVECLLDLAGMTLDTAA